MKRKLSCLLIILICFCSLTLFSSCDAVLDLIFGSKTPSTPTDTNEPVAHVHKMSAKTYVGDTCSGQSEITYYQCGDCGKYFLDGQGEYEISDVSLLEQGHLYVIKFDELVHYEQCALCDAERPLSRAEHSSDSWWYSSEEHYKLCDVCGYEIARGSHDVEGGNGDCSVCGRKTDYVAMCNGSYGYSQLTNDGMRKLYSKINDAVSYAHDNSGVDATRRKIGETPSGQTVYAYALSDLNVSDCSVTVADAYIAIASFIHDNPLYYWLDKQCSVTYYNNGSDKDTDSVLAVSVTLCVLDDYANGAARTQRNKQLYSAIDGYLSAVSGETDPYYIALSLHDRLIQNVSYAYNTNGEAEDAAWAHSIEGVFASNSAVCEGYAKAYQLLLNACNVNNIYVTGSSKNVGHAWNTVQLGNGNWYWYDLTWDDQPALSGGISYEYFCKTDSDFLRDHDVSKVKQGMNYLYDLPQVSSVSYESGNWEVGESITIDGITYVLIGYDRVAADKILTAGDNGIVDIPASVQCNGKTFTVRQINSEALVTYTYDESNNVISQAGPQVKTLRIPSSVDLIYSKSLRDCSTLVSVEFEDASGWSRCPLNGSTQYEQISADKLSQGATACYALKQTYKQSLLSKSYYYVWVKEN